MRIRQVEVNTRRFSNAVESFGPPLVVRDSQARDTGSIVDGVIEEFFSGELVDERCGSSIEGDGGVAKCQGSWREGNRGHRKGRKS